MANIKSIMNMHNKEVITEKKTEAVKCNCITLREKFYEKFENL